MSLSTHNDDIAGIVFLGQAVHTTESNTPIPISPVKSRFTSPLPNSSHLEPIRRGQAQSKSQRGGGGGAGGGWGWTRDLLRKTY